MHKVDLVLALVASAWADPATAKAALGEARAVLATLPPEVRALRSCRWVEAQVADAVRAAH